MWKLLVDFGLVILIWMTQLIVYPSFTYYSEEALMQWHPRYTVAISCIVMPLMLAQVGLHGWILTSQMSVLNLLAAVLIVLVWVNTFFFAVPLHNQIGEGVDVLKAADKLVKVNGYRTALWTLIFLLSLWEYLKK